MNVGRRGRRHSRPPMVWWICPSRPPFRELVPH